VARARLQLSPLDRPALLLGALTGLAHLVEALEQQRVARCAAELIDEDGLRVGEEPLGREELRLLQDFVEGLAADALGAELARVAVSAVQLEGDRKSVRRERGETAE